MDARRTEGPPQAREQPVSDPFRPRLRAVPTRRLRAVPDPDKGRHRAPDAPPSLTGVVAPPEPAGDYASEIPADLDDITKSDLVALAELADVPTYGTKADIAARLRAL